MMIRDAEVNRKGGRAGAIVGFRGPLPDWRLYL